MGKPSGRPRVGGVTLRMVLAVADAGADEAGDDSAGGIAAVTPVVGGGLGQRSL